MQKVSLLPCVESSDRCLGKNEGLGTGCFCSCTPLATPVLQLVRDGSKIILSGTGMEVSSLDPCNSQFWPSQPSLVGSSTGSLFLSLTPFCSGTVEAVNGVCCLSSVSVTWSPPMSHLSALGSGWSVLPSLGACLPLPLFWPSSPLCSSSGRSFHWDFPPNVFFCESTETEYNPLPLSEKWFILVNDKPIPLIKPICCHAMSSFSENCPKIPGSSGLYDFFPPLFFKYSDVQILPNLHFHVPIISTSWDGDYPGPLGSAPLALEILSLI